MRLPVVDITRTEATSQIGEACRESGFFYIVGHGVDEHLQEQVETISRRFFALDLETKMEIRMAHGGRAWRGYFPVGGELTSGQPDLKEGIYFGSELEHDHPLVKAGIPLHGPNLFPRQVPELREVILEYMAAMTTLGRRIMEHIAASLDLEPSYFADHFTGDPLILFRIFNYPSPPNLQTKSFGVGEHTDYGLLTILRQDAAGGLQVKVGAEWIDAEPIPNSFVCNIGDMLDRITGGLYLSTPHRVQNLSGRDRLSFPFFFDPNFNAKIRPITQGIVRNNASDRWDRASVHEFSGSYGDYLLNKVSRVFPELRRDVL